MKLEATSKREGPDPCSLGQRKGMQLDLSTIQQKNIVIRESCKKTMKHLYTSNDVFDL